MTFCAFKHILMYCSSFFNISFYMFYNDGSVNVKHTNVCRRPGGLGVKVLTMNSNVSGSCWTSVECHVALLYKQTLQYLKCLVSLFTSSKWEFICDIKCMCLVEMKTSILLGPSAIDHWLADCRVVISVHELVFDYQCLNTWDVTKGSGWTRQGFWAT